MAATATKKASNESEEEARYRSELNDAINKLPNRDAVKKVIGALDCKVASYIEGLEPRSIKEVLTRKPAEIPKDLIDIRMKVKGISDAYDAIENYKLVMDAMREDKKVEGGMLTMIRRSLPDEEAEKVINLMTNAMRGDKQAEDALLKAKVEAESDIELLMHSPAEIMKLRNEVYKALRDEL